MSTSRFPCCVLSYFSLVFVMEHSRRWWLHIGGSKMFEPLFRAEMSFLNHFFCKIFVFDISKLNFRCHFLWWCAEKVAERPFLQPILRLLPIWRLNSEMGTSMLLISRMNLKIKRSSMLPKSRMNPDIGSSMLPITRMRLPACRNGRF